MVQSNELIPNWNSPVRRSYHSRSQGYSWDPVECPQSRVGFLHRLRVRTIDGHCISDSVKRIVITSSIAAIQHDSPTPITFSELDWNEQSLHIVREKGREAPNLMKYSASKTLAEKGVVAAGLLMNQH